MSENDEELRHTLKLDKDGYPKMPLGIRVKHYIDTVGWAGTTVSVVFWTAVIILAYVLIF